MFLQFDRMKDLQNIYNREEKFLLHTYKRIPIEISHGEGVYLFSKDGKKYLDFFSGLSVNALGYGNPLIIKAIEEQIKKYIHLSNYYINEPQVNLAEKLVEYSGLSKVFFANSGTEAVEASLKLIRKAYGPDKKIITFSNAFHGRTYGSLSLSGRSKYKNNFRPLLTNILQLDFNNIEQLERTIDQNTAAVYIEFIQGEGGIQIASAEFVNRIIRLRENYGFSIVADEVQSGIGRTGKPFAYNLYDIEPDLIILAKSIGGGLPLGALICNQKHSNIFQPGDHGSTFGGNPVACAAGIVVLNQVFESGLINKVFKLGEFLKHELNILRQKYSQYITEVRGFGYMLGVEFKDSCSSTVTSFREKGVLVNCTNDNVLRILPPLISTRENIDFFLNAFSEILTENKL